MDEQEKTIGDKWVEFCDEMTNLWYEFANFVNEAFEEFCKTAYEVLAKVFRPNKKHKLQKRREKDWQKAAEVNFLKPAKIVKRLGCKPKTKIFKRFKDHRNCKKYRR